MGRVWKWRSISLKVATWEKMWQMIIHRTWYIYLPISIGLLVFPLVRCSINSLKSC